MLINIPTAVLDYTNSPHYVNAAWKILSKDHFIPVLNDLTNPSLSKLIYQHNVLNNCLECSTSSTPKMIRLIKEMIMIKNKCSKDNTKLEFPHRIIPLDLGGSLLPTKNFDFKNLYPNHPIFKKDEKIQLQKEIIYLYQKIKSLTLEIRFLKLKGIFATIIRKIFGKNKF